MKISTNQKFRSIRNLPALFLLVIFLLGFNNVGLSATNKFIQVSDEITVTGKVTAPDGETLPGATVLVKGTSTGTITDIDGNYKITVPANSTLVISFVGFVSREILVGAQSVIDIILEVDQEMLEEVVVIGYGTQRKSHLTGAISKVKNDNLYEIPVGRADQALIGQVSGINISTTGATGGSFGTSDQGVGGNPTIRIRGTGSVTGGADPLLVIDGVAVDYDFWTNIDINDIESFEILKDAASASIFGSRGANGVIMVTTKSGKAGKTKFSYDGFFGYQDVANNPDYNTSVATAVKREMEAEGSLTDRTRYKELIGVDNNWQDIIFNGGAIQSHALSARGGTDNTKFSAAISYLGDDGVMLTDSYEKFNLKAKIDTKVSDKVSFGISLNPSYSTRRRFDGSTHDILRQTPWLPVYHDENTIQYVDRNVYPDVQVGDYAIQRHFDNYDLDNDGGETDISNTSNTNPAAKVIERDRRDYRYKLFGKVYLDYKINDFFTVKTALSGTVQNTRFVRWQGVLSNRNGASAAQSDLQERSQNRIIAQGFVDYNREFGDHDINATVGVVSEQFNEQYSSITGVGYENDFVQTINNATTISDATSYEREKRLISYIARVNYAYQDKYLASVSVRRDGSSVFGTDTKYGNFPAISAGWRLSEEEFLAGNNIVSNLKLRISYGVTGNDNIRTGDRLTDWYAHLALLDATTAIVGGQATTAFNPNNIANPDLGWERSVEFNPAIDFGFLEDRITGSVDYYNRTSDGLLLNLPVSYTTGFDVALVNIGEVENKGFEIELRTVNIRKGDFSWSTTLIGSRNENTLTDFANSDGLIQNVDTKRAAEWINVVGEPISSFYGYVTDRDIPTEFLNNTYHPIGGEAQDVYVKDLNGDGLIDNDDKTILGSPYPDFIWSVANEFSYKNFTMSFMFQGSHGAEIRNMGDQYLYNHFNSSQDFNPATTPDQEFIQQKIFTDDIIQDASYVALRNVNIGYNIPANVLSKIGFTSARVYASGQNLLFFKSSDYTGFNPESITTTTPTTYGYQRAGGPITRAYTMGISLGF